MDHVVRLKNVFLDYLSPMAKRRRIFGPGMSSSNTEDLFLPTESRHTEKKTDAVVLQISYQNYLSIPQKLNPKKRSREDFEEVSRMLVDHFDPLPQMSQNEKKHEINQELDVLDIDVSMPSFEISDGSESIESQISKTDESENQASIDCEDNETKMSNARVQEYLERQAEFSLRKSDVARARASGDWHPDELFLFERLSLRGFEVLLPKSWKIDFPTLPHAIFAKHDNDYTVINTNFTSSAHGVKALQSLLNLGTRVRDNILTGAPTNKLISREINHFIKWSVRDGEFSKMRFLPVLTMVVARPKQTIDSLSAEIDKRMRLLAQKYREILAIPGAQDETENKNNTKNLYVRQPPLLYGIIVARTNIIFVTLDSAKVDAVVRHMQHFDFREHGTDAWIGFAIAILIIVARNYMMSIKNELKADETDLDVDL